MGLLYADLRSLLENSDVEGGAVATLGRLSLYLQPGELRKLQAARPGDASLRGWCKTYSWGQSSESFFTDVMKAKTVDSIDFSDYEGASIVQDLGAPVPEELKRRFDLVVDGGTLEHIFDIATALANVVHLVRVGGSVHIHGVANNQCGHGFYQFSPELMFRVFSAENGFEPVVLLSKARYVGVQFSGGHKVYKVADPEELGERVNLLSKSPVLILVTAKCVKEVEPFAVPILQSDYAAKWTAAGPAKQGTAVRLAKFIYKTFPSSVAFHLHGLYQARQASLRNRKAYTPIWR